MALLLAAGCGYRVVTGQSRVAGEQEAIDLEPVRNRTAEYAAGTILERRLLLRLRREGMRVRRGDAGLRLKVVLTSCRFRPLAVSASAGRFSARQQQLDLRATVRLERAGSVVWTERFSESHDFLSAPDIRGTEANRRAALEAALDRLAEAIARRLALVE